MLDLSFKTERVTAFNTQSLIINTHTLSTNQFKSKEEYLVSNLFFQPIKFLVHEDSQYSGV